MTDGYNGWKNWETWNVALWIQNDESLYQEARRYRNRGYTDFVAGLKRLGADLGSVDFPIATQTPDGVAWDSDELDIDALDAMLAEL